MKSLLRKPFDPNLESTVGADTTHALTVERSETDSDWRAGDGGATGRTAGGFGDHAARMVAARLVERGGGGEGVVAAKE